MTSPRHSASGAGRGWRPGWSIRQKLILAFGTLLVLGGINIGVYYWGASQRRAVFTDLQEAIDRQAVLMEVQDRLEDQKKFIDLITAGVLGTEAAAPSEAERARFADGLDAVVAQLATVSDSGDPAQAEALAALRRKAAALVTSWKQFYTYQGVEPARAIEELYVRAEPLAVELLTGDLPATIAHEKAELARVNAAFVETDHTFERLAWTSFAVSALLGTLLALFISRDLLHAVAALKAGADAIGAGRLQHRIDVPNRDELGDVAASFNQMAARLDERTAELERSLAHLKATQAQLVQSEKMASLGQLTAGIAHEIKNPLNFVNNFAALNAELADELREALEAGDHEEVRDLLEDLQMNSGKVVEHGRRADAIVRSMMAHARGGEGEREAVDVNAFVDEYVSLAYHGQRARVPDFNAEVVRDFAPDAGRVRLVPQEIGRVLLNLLSNAFDAVGEQADRAGAAYAPRVTVTTRRRGDGVEIHVADNGAGIPEHVREKIFEPFFTTKPTGQGTGLGLSLSYDIVTQGHGGTLSVESQPGAAFTVRLPAG